MPQKQPSVPLIFPVSITCEIFSLRGLPHGLEMFSLRNHDWMSDGPSSRCFTAESINSLGGSAPSCTRICRIRILAPVSLSAPFELVIQPICKRRAAGFLFNRASLASALECRPPDCRPDNLPARRPVYSLEWHRKRCGVT